MMGPSARGPAGHPAAGRGGDVAAWGTPAGRTTARGTAPALQDGRRGRAAAGAARPTCTRPRGGLGGAVRPGPTPRLASPARRGAMAGGRLAAAVWVSTVSTVDGGSADG